MAHYPQKSRLAQEVRQWRIIHKKIGWRKKYASRKFPQGGHPRGGG